MSFSSHWIEQYFLTFLVIDRSRSWNVYSCFPQSQHFPAEWLGTFQFHFLLVCGIMGWILNCYLQSNYMSNLLVSPNIAERLLFLKKHVHFSLLTCEVISVIVRLCSTCKIRCFLWSEQLLWLRWIPYIFSKLLVIFSFSFVFNLFPVFGLFVLISLWHNIHEQQKQNWESLSVSFYFPVSSTKVYDFYLPFYFLISHFICFDHRTRMLENSSATVNAKCM